MPKYYDYDKVRKIEQREDSRGQARQMAERALNFLGALRNPTKRIGGKREQRKANPDFVAPERIGESRFEQLDKEDRWSRTEYREGAYGDQEDGFAYITVQDPRDPDDIPSRAHTTEQTLTKRKHRVTGETEREIVPEKISQLVMVDDEGTKPEEPT